MKSTKKILCAALAGVSVFASVTMFTSCTTSHPQVQFKVEFNDKTYTLDYKLYRKMAPATVNHFIELTEKGYYDGLCFHDYRNGAKMVSGGYTYDENNADQGGLTEKNYFETVKDMNLTQTVWYDPDRTEGTNTVYGEFYDNGFNVDNGTLKQTYGSLTMYYTQKTDKYSVYVKRADGEGYNSKKYKGNSATSLFFISLSTSTVNNSQYCTFGTIEKDSEKELKELEAAINKYIKDEYEDVQEDFIKKESVIVDENDKYMSSAKESELYYIPKQPIIIKSAKVTKY